MQFILDRASVGSPPYKLWPTPFESTPKSSVPTFSALAVLNTTIRRS